MRGSGLGLRREGPEFWRLGEEQDEFCPTCVDQWHRRHDLDARPTCHICGRTYEDGEILYAKPVTHKEMGLASIACDECYQTIKARCLVEEMTKEETKQRA